jgi:energy-coupling factor transport system substrate-specific component
VSRRPAPGRLVSGGLAASVHLLGVVAFLYPFLLPARPAAAEGMAHAGDAPILVALLSPGLVLLAIASSRADGAGAKRVALLGVLAGLNAALRLPSGVGGAKLIYVLPILTGVVFGPGFGFLLGAASMAVSAVATGGVGPWVPFQMWALGWVGAGAGLLRGPLRRLGERPRVAALALYGWLAGHLYGALMNLWFWPFLGGLSEELSWRPGIGAAAAAARYARFYLATSLGWDAAAAIANLVLLAVLGGPLFRLLERFRLRVAPARIEPAPRAGSGAAVPATRV